MLPEHDTFLLLMQFPEKKKQKEKKYACGFEGKELSSGSVDRSDGMS